MADHEAKIARDVAQQGRDPLLFPNLMAEGTAAKMPPTGAPGWVVPYRWPIPKIGSAMTAGNAAPMSTAARGGSAHRRRVTK